jgi:hypothetical protein
MDSLPEEIREYFEIQLLWKPFPVIDENGNITTVYVNPENLNGGNKGQDMDKKQCIRCKEFWNILSETAPHLQEKFNLCQKCHEEIYFSMKDFHDSLKDLIQPERLNPETPQYDKEKDDAMGQYYASQINIVEMR